MKTMTHTTMKVSLPDELRDAAQRLSKKKQYSTTSGFIQHLIRREDAKDRETDKLRALIQEGIDSGVSEMPAEEFFTNLRKRVSSKAK